MTRGREAAALAAILALAALLRLGACGADVPLHGGISYAPVLDAFWYLEAAASAAEGLPVDPEPGYDPPVWVPLARVWFALVGVSWRSACALAGVVGVVLVLATWRLARSALGPGPGLAAAAVLATLYPQVIQSRVPLIYGPLAVWLLAAAALWLGARRRPAGARVACELLAWVMVLSAVAATRPPAAAFAGGLLCAHAARARRGRLLFGGLLGLVAGGVLLVAFLGADALEPPLALLGWVDPERAATLRYRLGLHLSQRLDLGTLARRTVGFFGPLRPGQGSGYLELAPGACAVAGLGLVAIAWRWRALSPAARELLALLLGAAGAFVLGGVLMEERPLRYFLLLGPTLAVSAGCAVAWASAPPGGASEEGRLRPPVRRLLAGGLLLLACAGGLGRGLELLLYPTRVSETANRTLPLVLGSQAVPCGPYASSLAIGSGLRRLRGSWVHAWPPEALAAALARLRAEGVTHLLVDAGQERNAELLRACAEAEAPLQLVAVLASAGPSPPRTERMRGAPVLVLRLPWVEGRSPYEQRRESDREAEGVVESHIELLLARMRALVRQGRVDRAQELARRSIAATPSLARAQARLDDVLQGW